MPTQYPIEFLVLGTPVSLQGKAASKSAWKNLVSGCSESAFPAGSPYCHGPLSVKIYYFSAAEMQGDIDNIVKPILDALCQRIYEDDKVIANVSVRRIGPGQPTSVQNPSSVLISAMTSPPPIVYINISNDPYGEPL